MKNGSHRCDINRTRPGHGHKYTKFEMCVNMMMVMSNQPQLSDIRSSIHEKVKQH